MSEIKTIENVHVEIYGHEMLSELITRARKNNIPYDREINYDFHSHGHSYLVLKDGELTLLEDPSEKHGEEISLNGFFELYLSSFDRDGDRVSNFTFSKNLKPIFTQGNKWYKHLHPNTNKIALIFVSENGKSYGFGYDGLWTNSFATSLIDGFWSTPTNEEVEKALIEEAKRRYQKGDLLSKVHEDFADDERFFESSNFSYQMNKLYFNSTVSGGYHYCIFKDGQWAEVIGGRIEPTEVTDKFAELKEAHRNGAEIQVKCTDGSWCDVGIPGWSPKLEYRIKPEEKPKVGEVVKAWVDDERDYIVGVLHDIQGVQNDYIIRFSKEENKFCTYLKARHSKPLTQQEAIELLFQCK